MALEKGTFARRKAQKLARDGAIAPAIEEMRLLVGEPETDPYDHVYLGDLLMRAGRPQEALDAWMQAVQSYDRAGLNRNAIAVGKKVLRLDQGRVAVHRTLGELYCREGLLGEAMPHFLHWLDTVTGDACFSEEFLVTLERAGSAVGLQVEAALRVGDHYLRAGHADRAARMLHGLADKVQTAGSPEMAAELRKRARAAEKAHDDLNPGGTDLPLEFAMAEDRPVAGVDVGDRPSLDGPVPPDAPAVESPSFRGAGDADGASGDPFPELIAAEAADSPALEMPRESSGMPFLEGWTTPPDGPSSELPVEPLDPPAALLDEPSGGPPILLRTEAADELPHPAPVDSFEPPAGPWDQPSEGPPTSAPSDPSGEPPAPLPVEFQVEHFPVGGSGRGPQTNGPQTNGHQVPDDLEAPAFGRALGDEWAGIDATPGEAPEDAVDDERIWDLDAEEEALRTDPAEMDGASGSVETAEMGAGPSWLAPLGPLEPARDPSAAPETLFPPSAWDEEPDLVEQSTESGPDETSWPPGDALRSLVDRADAAFGAGQWAEARGLYDRAGHEVSLEPLVLGRLVEIARKLEDSAAEVHYLEQLGDAWIEAGVMEEALEAFLEVLHIDPDSCTARRRLSRFQEMGLPGAERIPEATRESVQGVLESAGALMSVRDDPVSAIQSDEWIDLGALIEEFRDGIKNQIAGDDAPGHYDLAVSHHGMELFEEAVEELDAVLACPDLAVEMELHARELRGVCLLALRRHREAVHEFRTALERPVPDTESRCSILYHLGVALESAEEWREAAEIFDRVRDELPGFLDAEGRQSACEMRANGIDPEARVA